MPAPSTRGCCAPTRAHRQTYLAGVVKGEPEEEDVGEGLDYAEESVHHPVGEPLRVVFLHRALDGFDTSKGGETSKSRVQMHLIFLRYIFPSPLSKSMTIFRRVLNISPLEQTRKYFQTYLNAFGRIFQSEMLTPHRQFRASILQ